MNMSRSTVGRNHKITRLTELGGTAVPGIPGHMNSVRKQHVGIRFIHLGSPWNLCF